MALFCSSFSHSPDILKPNAQIRTYDDDDDDVLELPNSHDQALTLDSRFEIWKQSALDADELAPEANERTVTV